MFKENYMKELAFKNIKKQSKLYKYVAIALFMSFFLSSFMFIMFSSYDEISFQERSSYFGKWSIAIDNNMRKNIIFDYTSNQGKVYFLSSVYDKERELGKLGSLDNEAIAQVNLQMVKGNLPNNENEIAIEEEQCDYLGIVNQVGKIIDLEIEENGQRVLKQLKLVGITKNHTSTYPIEIPSFLTNEVSEEYTLVMNSADNLALINSFVDNQQDQYVTFNNYTYNNYTWNTDRYTDSSTVIYMEFLIVAIGVIGVVSTMVSVMNKRAEYYVLIRSLGATLFQIQKTILYECLYLMLPTVIIGTLSGVLLSGLVLTLYHYISQYPFLIVINIHLLLNIGITLLFTFISMFIVSLGVYKTPLKASVKQRIVKSKKRNVKKLNILSLAILEVKNNKKIFVLLAIFVGISMIFSSFLFNQYYQYISNENEEIGFSHQISGESLIKEDILPFHKIDGTNSLYFQYQYVKAHVNGLEEWDGASQYQDKTDELPFHYWLSSSNIVTIENNVSVDSIFSKQYLKGRLPKNKYETLAIVPYIDISTSKESFYPIKNVPLESKQINIGDNIDIADISGEKTYHQQLNVVGTLHYKVDDKKISELTSYGGYQFVVNYETYSDFFQETGNKSIYFDTEDLPTINQMKSKIYSLMQKKSDISFFDNISMSLLYKAQQRNDFYKDISFSCLFIIGILFLIYIQRKLRFIALKQEIGLMKAIGLTDRQLISIYFIYDFFVYVLSLLILFIIIIFINKGNLFEIKDILFNKVMMCSALSIGILVSIIMILPILIEENISIIEQIRNKE